MSQTEVLEEIQRMPLAERLDTVETALRMTRAALPDVPLTREERRQRLAASAQLALPHYLADAVLSI